MVSPSICKRRNICEPQHSEAHNKMRYACINKGLMKMLGLTVSIIQVYDNILLFEAHDNTMEKNLSPLYREANRCTAAKQFDQRPPVHTVQSH